MLLNLAMNYGGRSEIVRATKRIVKAFSDGNIKIEDVDEHLLQSIFIQMVKMTQT